MSIFRSTVIICCTVLLSIAAILLYQVQRDRFTVLSAGEAVVIYDQKNSTMTICDMTGQRCRVMAVETYPGISMPSQGSIVTPSVPKNIMGPVSNPLPPVSKEPTVMEAPRMPPAQFPTNRPPQMSQLGPSQIPPQLQQPLAIQPGGFPPQGALPPNQNFIPQQPQMLPMGGAPDGIQPNLIQAPNATQATATPVQPAGADVEGEDLG